MSIYRYRVWCTTDSKYEYTWGDSEPTKCPIDTGHTIDSVKTSIEKEIADNTFTIQEEKIKTGGNYRLTQFNEVYPASAKNVVKWSRPFPITILAISFSTTAAQAGDLFEAIIAEDTSIGIITADVAVDDTIINVNDTVLENIMVGYKVKLDDGVNADALGHVLSIDTDNKTITTESKSSNVYLAATPTYVKMSVCMMDEYEIEGASTKKYGDVAVGGSYLPANTEVSIYYTNNQLVDQTIRVAVEHFY